MAAIDTYLNAVQDRRASDLHLSAGAHPCLRIDGSMITLKQEEVLTADSVLQMALGIMPDYAKKEFETYHDADFSYTPSGGSVRFRINVFTDRKGTCLVARALNNTIPTLSELGMPDTLTDFCRLNKGLFIVTGPTGSGKSTTLASMIDHINTSRTDHIITIENPIEYLHDSKSCLVHQREVPQQASDFARALRAALREDPDVVMVGEMRDLETIQTAIETAETGHLVLGTLHTSTAYSAVNRIIDVFPEERQGQIRTMLASSLRGVLAQTLCRKPQGGRCAATELLVITDAAANMIREGLMHQIPSLMQAGGAAGMHLLDASLAGLAAAGTITEEEARRHAKDKEFLQKRFSSQELAYHADKGKNGMQYSEDPDWLKGE